MKFKKGEVVYHTQMLEFYGLVANVYQVFCYEKGSTYTDKHKDYNSVVTNIFRYKL